MPEDRTTAGLWDRRNPPGPDAVVSRAEAALLCECTEDVIDRYRREVLPSVPRRHWGLTDQEYTSQEVIAIGLGLQVRRIGAVQLASDRVARHVAERLPPGEGWVVRLYGRRQVDIVTPAAMDSAEMEGRLKRGVIADPAPLLDGLRELGAWPDRAPERIDLADDPDVSLGLHLVGGFADWSPWVPLRPPHDGVPTAPGVFMVRRSTRGAVKDVVVAPQNLREDLAWYSVRTATRGMRTRLLEEALADATWLRARAAETEQGRARDLDGWIEEALVRAYLHVCWAPVPDRSTANRLRRRCRDALAGTGLW
jgi:hypothetical protein